MYFVHVPPQRCQKLSNVHRSEKDQEVEDILENRYGFCAGIVRLGNKFEKYKTGEKIETTSC